MKNDKIKLQYVCSKENIDYRLLNFAKLTLKTGEK